MGRRFGTTVLVLLILFCLLTTWVSGTAPQGFAASLGFAIANPGGINEIRAQYSGFFLATGIVCTVALFGAIPRSVAFIGAIALFGGLFAGRLVSLALNGGVDGYEASIIRLYFIDAIGVATAVAALLADRRTAVSR